MVCNSGIIEDELHFICHCHYYEHYRNELYLLAYNVYENSNFYDLAVIDKFVFIMSSEKMVLKLAWFIQHLWREGRTCCSVIDTYEISSCRCSVCLYNVFLFY